jgi:hypothetical protein
VMTPASGSWLDLVLTNSSRIFACII